MAVRYVILIILLLSSALYCRSQELTDIDEELAEPFNPVDSILVIEKADTLPSTSPVEPSDTVAAPKKDNFIKAFIRQLIGGNADKTFEKPIDFSFAVTPSYTREASFGIGGMITGLYRLDHTDSIMQPSDVSFIANASLTGFYNFMLKGNTNFKGRHSRLIYDVAFSNKPLDFWGISYDACVSNAMIKYTRRQLKFNADYIYKISSALYVGATLNLNYSFISSIDDMSYLQGQKDSYFFTGVGLSLQYDTRDFVLNPSRGLYFMLKEVVYPRPFGNAGKTYFSTTLIFDYYCKLWKGGVLAVDLYGLYNGDDVPWPLRAELGAGGARMRGYYAGRYTDNNQVNLQLELRQRIYGRLGAVVWGGCGTVFPSFSGFKWSHLLFNYGLGLRFEFKHNVNLRVDYGFGKHTGGFVFSVAEAF